jgi:hypothetical protein
MRKTEAAEILARHVLSEAVARGVSRVTDEFARDVIAEATLLGGTRYDFQARAALARPALSRVRSAARSIIERSKAS